MSGFLPGFLLALAPLMVLVGFLLFGRYPGAARIERCRQALVLLLRGISARHPGSHRPVALFLPVRGGRLIASSMAGRAPPFQS